MLHPVAPELWHAQHLLRFAGLDISARMTVARLPDGGLWLHSPVHLSDTLAAQLAELGEVAHVLAPSKSHSGFLDQYLAAYPQAHFHIAPGLERIKPRFTGLTRLTDIPHAAWAGVLDQRVFAGIPALNEVVFFHRPSRSLILTDLCQWIQGDLPLRTRLVARLTGVRERLALPLQLKLFTRDKARARASRDRILAWPFERVIVAHDQIIETDAHAQVARALSWLDR